MNGELNQPLSISAEEAYQQGIRDGKLASIERVQACHEREIENIKGSIVGLQKMNYALAGAVALMQFAPALRGFFQ